jgi:hypothetical protein
MGGAEVRERLIDTGCEESRDVVMTTECVSWPTDTRTTRSHVSTQDKRSHVSNAHPVENTKEKTNMTCDLSPVTCQVLERRAMAAKARVEEEALQKAAQAAKEKEAKAMAKAAMETAERERAALRKEQALLERMVGERARASERERERARERECVCVRERERERERDGRRWNGADHVSCLSHAHM